MSLALQDLGSGLLRWRLWSMLAIDDWRIRYHRTLIGPIWIMIAFMAFVLVKLLIFTNMSSADAGYFSAYLTIGFMIWIFLSQAVTDGGSAFVKSKNWILGINAPFSLFLYSVVVNCLINAAFTAIPAIAISYWVHPFPLTNLIMAVFGFLFVAFSIFWAQLLLAVLSVFVRDVMQFVATAMRVFFFLTPILWMPSQIGGAAVYAKYNPFTYYINLVRDLVLTGQTAPINWIVVSAITALLMITALTVFSFAYRRIPSYI